jgi:hypothetical protein
LQEGYWECLCYQPIWIWPISPALQQRKPFLSTCTHSLDYPALSTTLYFPHCSTHCTIMSIYLCLSVPTPIPKVLRHRAVLSSTKDITEPIVSVQKILVAWMFLMAIVHSKSAITVSWIIFISHKGLFVDKDIRRMVAFMGMLPGKWLVIGFLHSESIILISQKGHRIHQEVSLWRASKRR